MWDGGLSVVQAYLVLISQSLWYAHRCFGSSGGCILLFFPTLLWLYDFTIYFQTTQWPPVGCVLSLQRKAQMITIKHYAGISYHLSGFVYLGIYMSDQWLHPFLLINFVKNLKTRLWFSLNINHCDFPLKHVILSKSGLGM